MGGLRNGIRAWVAEAKKEAGPDEFLRNSSDSASYFLCSFSLGHLDESGWDENKNYSNSTKTNAFCLGIILCNVSRSFDYLIYPYYPAYTS